MDAIEFTLRLVPLVFSGMCIMALLPSLNVLVLNRYYAQTHVCSMARAISLIFTEHAEIIYNLNGEYLNFSFTDWIEACAASGMLAEYCLQDPLIQSSSVRFLAPRAIRLTQSSYIPNGRRQLRPTRKNILMRDHNTCQYCHKRMQTHQLNLDHVIPKSRGGPLSWDNLVACCLRCNTRKGSRLPDEAGMYLKNKPSQPSPVSFYLMKLDPKVIENYSAFLGMKPMRASG